jgi:hypothetical protein
MYFRIMENQILKFIFSKKGYDYVNLNDFLKGKLAKGATLIDIQSSLKNLHNQNKIQIHDENHYKLIEQGLDNCKLKAIITDNGKNDIQNAKSRRLAICAFIVSVVALFVAATSLLLQWICR